MVWHVRIDRVGEVLDFLGRVPTCTGGEWAPVRDDGFGSGRQIQFLVRQEWQAAYRDMSIVLMPPAAGE